MFGSRDLRLLPRFIAVYLLYFNFNLGSLQLLVKAGLPPLLAQLLLLPWLSALNFLVMRRLVFAQIGSDPGTECVELDSVEKDEA